MAYRSAIHSSTGFSPNEMMFGRQTEQPVNMITAKLPTDKEVTTTSVYATKLSNMLDKIHHCARKNLELSNQRQKKGYDRRQHFHSYEQGDCVWYWSYNRKKGISPKLLNRWIGPCVIIKKLNDVTFKQGRKRMLKLFTMIT